MAELSGSFRRQETIRRQLAVELVRLSARSYTRSHGIFSEIVVSEVAAAIDVDQPLMDRTRAIAVEQGSIEYVPGGYRQVASGESDDWQPTALQVSIWNMLNQVEAQRNALRETGRLILMVAENNISYDQTL